MERGDALTGKHRFVDGDALVVVILVFPVYGCRQQFVEITGCYLVHGSVRIAAGDVPVEEKTVEETQVYLVDVAFGRTIWPKQVCPPGIKQQAEAVFAGIVFRYQVFPVRQLVFQQVGFEILEVGQCLAAGIHLDVEVIGQRHVLVVHVQQVEADGGIRAFQPFQQLFRFILGKFQLHGIFFNAVADIDAIAVLDVRTFQHA